MNFVTVETVIDRTVRRFNLREWVYDIEDMSEDIAEAVRFIGAFNMYAQQVYTLEFTNGRARLPLDFQHMVKIHSNCKLYPSIGYYLGDVPDGTLIQITYQALPLDARGLPLVPGAVEVQEAVMWFLAKVLILRGEISAVPYQLAEQEWQWRCRSARASINIMGVDDWARLANDHLRLNPLKDVHEKDYQELGKPTSTLQRDRNNNTSNRRY